MEAGDFSNVTHYTKVDVQPGGMNIQHVEHLHQADVLKALGIELEVKGKTPTENEVPVVEEEEMELFHFIHPAVLDTKEQWQIHNEVKRLVCKNSIPDICNYLLQMRAEDKILLPISGLSALKELQRMGMPGEEIKGFSQKNFLKYYHN